MKPRTIILAAVAVAALTACGTNYRPIQADNAAAVGAGTRGFECDFLPLECNGLRSGGSVGVKSAGTTFGGGTFPAETGLRATKEHWEAKNAALLQQQGLKGWDDYAAKYGLPNGTPISVANFDQ